MVERFGGGALREIDLRISELQSHGESKAVDLWKDVREVVCRLQLDDPDGTRH